jgi:preprotein translocase subunit SecD
MRLTARVAGMVALAAWVGSLALAADKADTKVEVRRAESKSAEGLTEATVAGSDEKVYLYKEAELAGEDFASARVVEDKPTGFAVEIVFTKEGMKKAAKLSEKHADKPLAILVDGKVVAAPVLKAKLGEKVLITGKFTKEQAEKLATSVKSQ